MAINRSDIHKILFITLSNLGDIILTTPVLEKLHDEFPEAEIDVITGPSGKEIFARHPAVGRVEEHKKHQSLADRARQALELRNRKYDIVVDLKRSLIPYVIGARYGSSLVPLGLKAHSRWIDVRKIHKREEHLLMLRGLVAEPFRDNRFFMPISKEERNFADKMMGAEWLRTIVINPGAKSHLKRWDAEKYAKLADRVITELKCRVFLTGNDDDRDIVKKVLSRVTTPVLDMCSKTSIGALAEMMKRSDLVITNDSAPLHIASAVNVPTVAIFGPSDDAKYGPLALKSKVVKPDVPCRPCGEALCSIGPDEGCISRVSVEEVFEAVRALLGGNV